MMQTIWFLAVAYVALGVLVLALNIRSGWPLWIRLACIVLVSGLYFVTWQSLQGIRGWPARTELPAHFRFDAARVIEPNEDAGEAGRIFLWLTPIVDDQPTDLPRAYRMPYQRRLHSQIEHARQALRNGQIQVGQASTANKGKRAPNAGYFAPPAQNVDIRSKPEPRLPEK